MAHWVNILVDEQVWESLQKIPKGERSQFINVAIKERLHAMKRKVTAQKMDELRVKLKPVKEDIDVLEFLRRDRMRDARVCTFWMHQ